MLSLTLGGALATSDVDNVGLLMKKVSVHDKVPSWFKQTDPCVIEYCQVWKDLREKFCCGSLPKDPPILGYCTEDPANPLICDVSNNTVVGGCASHLTTYVDTDALQRMSSQRRYLYSHECGGYKVTMKSSCGSCGEFTFLTMEEGIKAWNDRDYRYRNLPPELVGATFFRGCHKCYPIGTVFTFEGVPPGRKVCAFGERAHLYRHGKFPKTLVDAGWTQISDESMIWEFSPTFQIAMDIFCIEMPAGGTITLPATEGNVFTGGFAVEAECNWDCYLARYPNIATTTGNSMAGAKQHWDLHGKDEGRICTCPPAGCDWDCYLQRYPDLSSLYGGDKLKAQNHYEKYGASEGRDCSCSGSMWATSKASTTLTDT